MSKEELEINKGPMIPVKPKKVEKADSKIPGEFGQSVNTMLDYANGLYPKEAERNLVCLSSVHNEDLSVEPNLDVCIVKGSIPGIGGALFTAGMSDEEFGKIICAAAVSLTASSENLANFTLQLQQKIQQEIAEARSKKEAKTAAPPQEASGEEE